MLFLTTAQNPQPDFVALAMVLALAAIVAVMAIRKRLSSKKEEPIAAPVMAEEPPKPTAPGSAGQIKLHGVDPKIAAMLMAIVADKMGKPINELRFLSIKEVE